MGTVGTWILKQKTVLLWLVLTTGLGAWLTHLLLRAEDKTALLPGLTTDGHYQIEMECAACHDNEERRNVFTSSGVTNAGCLTCHGEDLEEFSDSHPIRKFRNPENAVFLGHIDALNCITCHTEHDHRRRHGMGVTIPPDFCAHCHEVTLEHLESHQGLSYKTCATAGCHNYHDNTALAPSFLLTNYGKADTLGRPRVPIPEALKRWLAAGNKQREALALEDADAPPAQTRAPTLMKDWHGSAHAAAGINCTDCHNDANSGTWIDKPGHPSCATCHSDEVRGFLKGKHGMRLGAGLPAITPKEARLPMKPNAPHSGLSCSSCHEPHRYDRQFAAQEACIQCHDDTHTRAYKDSPHFALWQRELSGELPAGSGVSCATCHLPREVHGSNTVVIHDQNANLRPNEKMLQNTCLHCHGQHFAMSALADRKLIDLNFKGRPGTLHEGMSWTVESAIKRGDQDIINLKKYLKSTTRTEPNPKQ